MLNPLINRDAYDGIARSWDLARTGLSGRERVYLDAVLAAAPAGATILDLGCGTGRPMAEYVVSQGRRILGVDQSEAMLEIARQRLPSERWVLASMETFEPAGSYGGALLWDSLFHVRRTEHQRILDGVLRGLPAGGRLMLTVGGSAHPEFTDFMLGHEFYYDSHVPDEVERLIRDLGCRIVLAEYLNRPDGGRDKGRYAMVAEKTS
jgi:ubiquinone/menaquinone biosynthesis C-methylase UbiE